MHGSSLRSLCNFVLHPRRHIRNERLRRKTPEDVFTDIYRENGWKCAETISGLGSSLGQTTAIRSALPRLFREFCWRSMLDIPCGDFHWMNLVALEVDYVGADIVGDLVEKNNARYGRLGRRFVALDLLTDRLPSADVVLCRDCLVHFSNQHIHQAIRNLRASGSEYLLTTTHLHGRGNRDIPTGCFRPVDLQAGPFHFPSPLRLIDEQCTHRGTRGAKLLGLWRLADIPEAARG